MLLNPDQGRGQPIKKLLLFNETIAIIIRMKPLRIAQISDFHFTNITWNPLRLFSKRFLGNLNWIFKRKNAFSDESLEALPSLLSTLQLDWIFLGGDFTTTALPEEYQKAKDFVGALPTPWIAIPGNHDHYTAGAYKQKRFYQSLANPSPSLFGLE